ncbi:MAG: hypothetical protein JWP95_1310 [Actinotalea sp.]|nr:hypothetical protein [Actinotalea sp.]
MSATTAAPAGWAPARLARPGPSNGSAPGPRPRPRLLLPPRTEPTGVLPLPLPIPPSPQVHSVISPVTEGSWPVAAPVRPTQPETPADPTKLCGSIVLAAVEALNGSRPLVQLVRWVSPEVFESLGAATSGRRAGSDAPRIGSPARSVHRDRGVIAGPPSRARVRRTHLTRVSPTVAEASVVIHDGDRVRAAAVRMEMHRGHWRATVLQIG